MTHRAGKAPPSLCIKNFNLLEFIFFISVLLDSQPQTRPAFAGMPKFEAGTHEWLALAVHHEAPAGATEASGLIRQATTRPTRVQAMMLLAARRRAAFK